MLYILYYYVINIISNIRSPPRLYQMVMLDSFRIFHKMLPMAVSFQCMTKSTTIKKKMLQEKHEQTFQPTQYNYIRALLDYKPEFGGPKHECV